MPLPFKQGDFFFHADYFSANALSGRKQKFFFVFAKEDSLVESRYAYNPTDFSLEHYSEEPTDYEPTTFQTKEACLADISDCEFSYSDGAAWETSWGIDKGGFPVAIKVNFRFRDEDKNREFVVDIPISP